MAQCSFSGQGWRVPSARGAWALLSFGGCVLAPGFAFGSLYGALSRACGAPIVPSGDNPDLPSVSSQVGNFANMST